MSTPEEFAVAAQAAGMRALFMEDFVNLWRRDRVEQRFADTTVWFTPEDPTVDVVWGDSYEHHAPQDTTAERLVRLVEETL